MHIWLSYRIKGHSACRYIDGTFAPINTHRMLQKCRETPGVKLKVYMNPVTISPHQTPGGTVAYEIVAKDINVFGLSITNIT